MVHCWYVPTDMLPILTRLAPSTAPVTELPARLKSFAARDDVDCCQPCTTAIKELLSLTACLAVIYKPSFALVITADAGKALVLKTRNPRDTAIALNPKHPLPASIPIVGAVWCDSPLVDSLVADQPFKLHPLLEAPNSATRPSPDDAANFAVAAEAGSKGKKIAKHEYKRTLK
jgi:hypothetical protein